MSGEILLKFKLVQAFMVVLVTCKNEEDPINKNIFFTFPYCKSTGDDDPRGVANLDPRSMIGRIYVGYHLLLLHTKYKSSGPHGLRKEDFFYIFLFCDYGR